MIKWILRTNEWYDKLKEPKRALFFLLVVFLPITISLIFMYRLDNYFVFPALCLIYIIWRGIPLVVKDWRDYKEKKR